MASTNIIQTNHQSSCDHISSLDIAEITGKKHSHVMRDIRNMGFEPYVMVYDKAHAVPFYKSLQRWVNMRAIFHKIPTFEEYDRQKAKE